MFSPLDSLQLLPAPRKLLGLLATTALLSTEILAAPTQAECEVSVVESAQPIQLGYGCHTRGATIGSSVDSDAYSIACQAGDSVRIIVDQTSDDCMGLRVDVFGPSGFVPQAAATQPSCYYGDVSHSLVMPLTLDLAGDYVVLVSDPYTDQAGAYTLQIERLFPAGPATVLGYGVNQPVVLSPTTDVEISSFFGRAGSKVRVNVDQTSDNCMGVHLEVLDPTGATILDEACQPSCYYGDVSCSFYRDLDLSLSGRYLVVLSDPGADQEGSLDVSLNCILGCPPIADATQRNGSGTNPLVYAGNPPVLGGTWRSEVDTTAHAGATGTAIFTFLRPLVPGMPYLGLGELLVDIASPQVGPPIRSPIDADGISRFRIDLPRTAALAGLRLSTQAVILGGGARLTNAVDLVLGY